MEQTSNNTSRLRILVFGAERAGIEPPADGIERADYVVTFEPFDTSRRFNDFDGVVVFQGIFEKIEPVRGSYLDGPSLNITCREDDLDRRLKETGLLMSAGGFLCVVLRSPFIDQTRRQDCGSTDLAKCLLNIPHFYRKKFSTRQPSVRATRNEWQPFLELYGAANTWFENLNDRLDLKVLAKTGRKVVGLVIDGKKFFVPSLPLNNDSQTEEYFKLLCCALVGSRKQLAVELPDWLDEHKLPGETDRENLRQKLLTEVSEIDDFLARLALFKRVLVYSGDILVDAVRDVLEHGFGFRVDPFDEFREDLKVLDEEHNPLALIEVKGTNAGLKREHVNQTDSHRERAGFQVGFPTLLVINPLIKSTRSLSDKDKELPIENVEHAARNRVLVLRTLDLLRLLGHVMDDRCTAEQVLTVLTSETGWLQVGEDGCHIVKSEGDIRTLTF